MKITIDNLSTNFQSIGHGSDCLLLLHGWGNQWDAWSPLIPQLSQKYRLIIPDLPGFGHSESPASGWNMSEYVLWLEGFLHELNVSKLSGVLGHSFGGKLAAFGWWGESSSLPVVDKGFYLISPSGIRNELSPSRRIMRSIAQAVPQNVKRGLLAKLRKTVYTRLLKETDYFSATKFQEETLNLILPQDIRDFSSENDWPLHLCWGEHDEAVPLWMAYEFAQLSADADVFVLPKAGHFPHHQQPQLILSWLKANGL